MTLGPRVFVYVCYSVCALNNLIKWALIRVWLPFWLSGNIDKVCVSILTYTHTYIRTHTYILAYVCMYVCMYVYLKSDPREWRISYHFNDLPLISRQFLHMYVCMCVCMYVCMHVRMCMYVCMNVCMYACIKYMLIIWTLIMDNIADCSDYKVSN